MDIDNNIVTKYIQGQSACSIGDELKIPYWKVYYILKKANISRRSNKLNSRKYSVNDNFFHSIDSVEKAYWLGFMYADGFVTKDKKIGISIGIKDKEHLDKFKYALNATYPILNYTASTSYGETSYSKLLICSEQLKNDLIKWGCVENKSLVLKPPLFLSIDFIKHFIRGYIDGDGSLCLSTQSNGRRSERLTVTGTKEMLEWINNKLPESGWLGPYARKPYIYQLKTDCKKARENIRWLYSNAPVYLERKYAIAMALLGAISKIT